MNKILWIILFLFNPHLAFSYIDLPAAYSLPGDGSILMMPLSAMESIEKQGQSFPEKVPFQNWYDMLRYVIREYFPNEGNVEIATRNFLATAPILTSPFGIQFILDRNVSVQNVQWRKAYADEDYSTLDGNIAYPHFPLGKNTLVMLNSIAEGGMGHLKLAVAIGRDAPSGLLVIKERIPNADISPQDFLQEARRLLSLSHVNIPNFLGSGEYTPTEGESVPYIVQEFVPGIDLQSLVKHQRPLDEETAWQLLTTLALTIAHVHTERLVHRDIKPANIIVSVGKGRINKIDLVDFGMASRVANGDFYQTSTTSQGRSRLLKGGTPGYMSPTQAMGGEVTPADDIFSLGLTMFYALTGTDPHTVEGIGSGNTDVVWENYGYGFATGIGDLINRMIKWPANIKNAQQLLAILDEYKRPQVSPVRTMAVVPPHPTLPRATSRPRRRWIWGPVLAFGGMFVLGPGGLWESMSSQSPRPRSLGLPHSTGNRWLTSRESPKFEPSSPDKTMITEPFQTNDDASSAADEDVSTKPLTLAEDGNDNIDEDPDQTLQEDLADSESHIDPAAPAVVLDDRPSPQFSSDQTGPTDLDELQVELQEIQHASGTIALEQRVPIKWGDAIAGEIELTPSTNGFRIDFWPSDESDTIELNQESSPYAISHTEKNAGARFVLHDGKSFHISASVPGIYRAQFRIVGEDSESGWQTFDIEIPETR